MSRLLFELVGPDYALARAEIISALEGLSFDYDIAYTDQGILSLKTECPVQELYPRLGLTHRIYEMIGRTSGGNFSAVMEEYNLPPGTTAVRTRCILGHEGDTKKIKEELGDIISGTNPIDLDSPDHEIVVLITENRYVGRKICDMDKDALRSREVKNRPFSFPISLKPRYTRALLNLARPSKNAMIHDPFCGTGGILIEGYKMGFQMSGGDKDPNMIEGCKENLEEFRIEARLEVGDVSETIPRGVDCVVTDPPYGRASSTSKEDLYPIYERLFTSAEKRLKVDGYLTVVFPSKKYVSLGKGYLELIERYKVRVHRSLNRYFTVFKKTHRES